MGLRKVRLTIQDGTKRPVTLTLGEATLEFRVKREGTLVVRRGSLDGWQTMLSTARVVIELS